MPTRQQINTQKYGESYYYKKNHVLHEPIISKNHKLLAAVKLSKYFHNILSWRLKNKRVGINTDGFSFVQEKKKIDRTELIRERSKLLDIVFNGCATHPAYNGDESTIGIHKTCDDVREA